MVKNLKKNYELSQISTSTINGNQFTKIGNDYADKKSSFKKVYISPEIDKYGNGGTFRNEPTCNNCGSSIIGDNRNGFEVCFNCGRIHSSSFFENEPRWYQFKVKTYKRIFYFNERCSRWVCEEPKIDPYIWKLIKKEAIQYSQRREGRNILTRENISEILRRVKISPEDSERFRSNKFKKSLLTQKRFYDKYNEKWKTIIWKLTKKKPNIPSDYLVNKIKSMFVSMQVPFEMFRHEKGKCDGRYNCDRYFECWHNFINYDFVFRKLLQIVEFSDPSQRGVYNRFKDEFPLVSEKIRNTKLRPLFFQICLYNDWPQCEDED
jgi:hypothetical protein